MSDFLPPDRSSIFFKDSQKYLPQTPPPQKQETVNPVQENQQNSNFLNIKEQSAEELAKQGFFPIGGSSNTSAKPVTEENGKMVSRTVVLEATPNATWALITGIAGLLFSLSFCKWYNTIPAIFSSCIAIYLSNSGMEMVKSSPHVFSTNGTGNLKTAKILGIVGLGICGLSFTALIIKIYSLYWSE